MNDRKGLSEMKLFRMRKKSGILDRVDEIG